MKHQTVGLYVGSERPDLAQKLEQLLQFLISHEVDFVFEHKCWTRLPETFRRHYHTCFQAESPPPEITLFVVVGGDGSFLHACQTLYQHQRPITGVNLGTLGFLTDIHTDALEEQLLPILHNKGEQDQRHFVCVRSDQLSQPRLALNDVAIQSGESGQMVELLVCIDDKPAYDTRCDGIIVSTATGSTAYALSAGGPLVHSKVDAMLLVPLAAHNLATRPSVIPGDSRVEVRVLSGSSPAKVSVDGHQAVMLTSNQSITVAKSDKSVLLVHPPHHDACAAWRSKLGWSQSIVRT